MSPAFNEALLGDDVNLLRQRNTPRTQTALGSVDRDVQGNAAITCREWHDDRQVRRPTIDRRGRDDQDGSLVSLLLPAAPLAHRSLEPNFPAIGSHVAGSRSTTSAALAADRSTSSCQSRRSSGSASSSPIRALYWARICRRRACSA